MHSARYVFALAALIALPLQAHAADQPFPVKAPPPAYPISLWDGFYAGINGGLDIGRNSSTATQVFSVPGIPINVTPANESFYHSPIGSMVGVQAGYNREVSSRFVLGLEADWQYVFQRDSTCVMDCGSLSVGFFNLGGAGESTSLVGGHRLQWLATGRARAGFATGTALWYVTGGVAMAKMKESYTFSASMIPGPPPPVPAGAFVGDFSHTKLGWTVGGGVETQLGSRWSLKLEYLYVDLGNVTDTMVINAPLFGIPTLPSSTTISESFRATDHIVRLGLNYRFGADTVVARY